MNYHGVTVPAPLCDHGIPVVYKQANTLNCLLKNAATIATQVQDQRADFFFLFQGKKRFPDLIRSIFQEFIQLDITGIPGHCTEIGYIPETDISTLYILRDQLFLAGTADKDRKSTRLNSST